MTTAQTIYVHDAEMWDAHKAFGRHATDRVIHLQAMPRDSVDNIVDKIRRALKGGPLKTLIFNGHGNCGNIHVGQGINPTNYILFADLKSAFTAAAGGGDIEIHSCHFLASGQVSKHVYDTALGVRSTANPEDWLRMEQQGAKARAAVQKSGEGEEHAKRFAKVTGARVKAAYQAQMTDKVGKFEGLWGCAWPDGRFARYPAQVRPDRVQ